MKPWMFWITLAAVSAQIGYKAGWNNGVNEEFASGEKWCRSMQAVLRNVEITAKKDKDMEIGGILMIGVSFKSNKESTRGFSVMHNCYLAPDKDDVEPKFEMRWHREEGNARRECCIPEPENGIFQRHAMPGCCTLPSEPTRIRKLPNGEIETYRKKSCCEL